jgi:hypothetical protein
LIAIFSLWLNRYLIVVPTLRNALFTYPGYPGRSICFILPPGWNGHLTFAGFASFLLMFTLIIKFVPVIPMSGIIDHERELAETKKPSRERLLFPN